jgi:hypothetical protein
MPTMTDAEPPKAPDSSRRIGRKAFSSYLHTLFGKAIPAYVRPDYAFSDDKGRYRLEVFRDRPDGMMLAVHLDSGPAGEVDVLTFREGARQLTRQVVVCLPD